MKPNLAVNAKAWVGLLGSLLTFLGPWLLQISVGLPPPWPAIISAIFAVLTFFGVYKVPNQLTQQQVDKAVAKGHVAAPEYKSPWPKP